MAEAYLNSVVGYDAREVWAATVALAPMSATMAEGVVRMAGEKASQIGRFAAQARNYADGYKPGQASVAAAAGNFARADAGSWLHAIGRIAGKGRIGLDDDDIRARAREAARHMSGVFMSMGAQTAEMVVARSEAACEAAGVKVPRLKGGQVGGMVARMTCSAWWRRAMRARTGRERERVAINAGLVHRNAMPYLSDEGHGAVMAKRRAFARMLSGDHEEGRKPVMIESDAGDEVELLRVVEGSVANPANRRAELMVRVRGTEEWATERGWRGYFVTATAPSRFHRMTVGGNGRSRKIAESAAKMGNVLAGHAKQNRKWDGEMPRDAQAWLVRQYARLRADWKRKGVEVIGLRVAEPHHDGCVHWHLMVWVDPAKAFAMLKSWARYWRRKEDVEEMRPEGYMGPGVERGAAVRRAKHARRARLQAKIIDPSKGDAASYVAAYISKNIDGHGLDRDTEADVTAKGGAERVRSWASVWGIRQFQWMGSKPVGVWRQLRRERDAANVPECAMGAWLAAGGGDRPDWKAYLDDSCDLALNKEPRANRYGEEVERVCGVWCGAELLVTRTKEWVIKWGSGVQVAVGGTARVMRKGDDGVVGWVARAMSVGGAVRKVQGRDGYSHDKEVEKRDGSRMLREFKHWFWVGVVGAMSEGGECPGVSPSDLLGACW